MKLGIVKILSTSFDKLKRLNVKSTLFGKPDNGFTVSPLEISPHGIDSRPVEDARGLYTTTATIGSSYILGYVNAGRKAGVGETRVYSTDENGTLKAYIWLKNTGVAQLNGNNKGGLPTVQELVTKLNNLENKVNSIVSFTQTHQHSGVTVGAGATGPSIIPVTGLLTPTVKSDIENTKVVQGDGS